MHTSSTLQIETNKNKRRKQIPFTSSSDEEQSTSGSDAESEHVSKKGRSSSNSEHKTVPHKAIESLLEPEFYIIVSYRASQKRNGVSVVYIRRHVELELCLVWI